MTVEQSPLERFPNQKQQSQTPLLNAEKDAASPTAGVIDLTNDGSEKEDDLKKAIALSLKEHEKVLGGQVSMEDQDISRVVEASLAESKAVGTKRKRGEVWQDPLNPHDRKRNGVWPVGLKNVGNTCWFSAVIQSLFHLPIFRKLVLSYSSQDWNIVAADGKEQRNLQFMRELRKLFALLLSTKRKYVDPSHALEEFKEVFPDSNGTDSQQDVSEFTHKLLEWLEEAFKINSSSSIGDNGESMMDKEDENPMLNLFYGHYLSEGLNEGRMFCNEETFGQYPLQVNGFNNIHDSLEAAMAQEIESYDVMTKSGQESWFTRLPPVLLFELSRFQFNQQIGRPEKIHNKLEFPQVMYMDRYMEQNKSTTRAIREKVHKLKEERDKLQTQLEKYLNYGSGSKKVPLSDVLQYTLDFAENQKPLEETVDEDVEMASPSSLSSTEGESPRNSPNKFNSLDHASSLNTHRSLQMNHVSDESVPSPQKISLFELKVLQSCLKRWRTEVENNVKNLQDNISDIENTIKEIYNNSSLQKKPYRLHAVLVHEGQAASGHYWAYVYCPKRQMWLKFNDVSVFESNWSELQKDSMGGLHYASAYCLLYVDHLRPELFDDGTRGVEIGPELLNTLPPDLQQYVFEDNEAFQLEIMKWEVEQTRKKDSSTMTVTDNDCTIIAEKRIVLDDDSTCRYFTNFSVENGYFNMEHAVLLAKKTVSKVESIKLSLDQSIEDAFSEVVQQEISSLRRLERLTTSYNDDPRLQHIGVYMLMNSKCCEPYINMAVLEQFLLPEVGTCPSGPLIKKMAYEKLETFHVSFTQDQRLAYKNWHHEYNMFRKLVSLFVTGIDHYHNHTKDLARFADYEDVIYCYMVQYKGYPSALNMFTAACELNSQLLALPGSSRGLDVKLLEHYRRLTCKKLNEMVATQFERMDNKVAFNALSVAYEHILPSMEFLASPTASEKDNEVAEKIRNRWCTMLAYDIASKPSPKQERLQDFLAKLLDSCNDMPKRKLAACHKRIQHLDDKYRSAMNIAIKSGEYQSSQLAK